MPVDRLDLRPDAARRHRRSRRRFLIGGTALAGLGILALHNTGEAPTGMAAAQTPGPTVLTLRPQARIRPVPEEVFGTNVEWIRQGNGLWNEKLGRLDPTILGMSRAAGITLIRFPGGVWSDYYNWRDGIGPQDQRPETAISPRLGETARHHIGTDEMVEFAKAIGAKLMITVNVGHGSAEEAAAWAAYIRDRHGPDIAPWWEIGNELYMADDLSGGSITPAVYAERLGRFATAIRAELPQARIAGIGLLNYGPYRFNAHDDWNEVVLTQAGEVIDALAIHNAYAPLTTESRTGQWESVYRSMMAAPDLIAGNLKDTAAQIDRRVPKRAGQIGLAVTEWGPFFAVDPKSPYFDHIKTLGSAVFVARALNTFLRDPRVEATNFFKLSDWLNMGWINHTPDGSFRETPALLAFGLYRNGLTGDLVEIRRDSGPTFAVRAQGFTGAVDAAAYVDAVASRTADGQLTVMVSNCSLDTSQEVQIHLEGATATGVQAQVLTGPAPDAHRGTAMIDVPGVAFAKATAFGTAGWFTGSKADTVGIQPLAVGVAAGVLTLTLPACSLAALRIAA